MYKEKEAGSCSCVVDVDVLSPPSIGNGRRPIVQGTLMSKLLKKV